MKSIIPKSLICGFIAGTVLFGIAPLGLGIYFIEIIKPVLVPGVLLTQLVLGNTIGSTALFLALLLNGMIYSILFYGLFKFRD